MKVAIMQPYLFPYIGYFQLIETVDIFVVYDNIKYTKKGWINRNRYLSNGTDATFSVPLRKDSDSLDIRERRIAADFNRTRLINQLKDAYRRAPFFEKVFPLVQDVFSNPESNLFSFLHEGLSNTCAHMNIGTRFVVSSTVDIDHGLQSQDKVLALCEALGAKTYVNPIGGQELYSKSAFTERGIELLFLKSEPLEYPQYGNSFVPWLSIIDVLMFNSEAETRNLLSHGFTLA